MMENPIASGIERKCDDDAGEHLRTRIAQASRDEAWRRMSLVVQIRSTAMRLPDCPGDRRRAEPPARRRSVEAAANASFTLVRQATRVFRILPQADVSPRPRAEPSVRCR